MKEHLKSISKMEKETNKRILYYDDLIEFISSFMGYSIMIIAISLLFLFFNELLCGSDYKFIKIVLIIGIILFLFSIFLFLYLFKNQRDEKKKELELFDSFIMEFLLFLEKNDLENYFSYNEKIKEDSVCLLKKDFEYMVFILKGKRKKDIRHFKSLKEACIKVLEIIDEENEFNLVEKFKQEIY